MSAGLGHLRELLLYGCPDALAVIIGGGDSAVVVLDGCLNGIEALGALVALVAQADEVLEGAAVAGVSGVGQSSSAGSAEDAALEVVGVLTVALPGELMGGENRLYAVA